jgi:hypothetical protein
MPSRVIPLAVNWTRVVEALPKKRPPLSVRIYLASVRRAEARAAGGDEGQ